MERHRKIAAAPERRASQCWRVVGDLIRDSLLRSEEIDAGDVDAALGACTGIGTQLIANGHLDKEPIAVIAASLDLRISTVSGDPALGLDENLSPVPGAAEASAEEWTVYVPAPEHLSTLLKSAVDAHPRLSSDPPPVALAKKESSATGSRVDLDALSRLGPGGSS